MSHEAVVVLHHPHPHCSSATEEAKEEQEDLDGENLKEGDEDDGEEDEKEDDEGTVEENGEEESTGPEEAASDEVGVQYEVFLTV